MLKNCFIFAQQFAVQLAAHVIQQYPLPEAMGVAKDIFKRLMVLANEIPADMREAYFLPLLPAVVKLCQTFPPLCTEATEFLVCLSKVCVSRDVQSVKSKINGLQTVSFGQDLKSQLTRDNGLHESIQSTFQELVSTTVVKL